MKPIIKYDKILGWSVQNCIAGFIYYFLTWQHAIAFVCDRQMRECPYPRSQSLVVSNVRTGFKYWGINL